MSNNTSPKKPSLLGIGSPRASPFRRPESPASARSTSNSTIRGTPTSSPSKPARTASNVLIEQPSSPASTTSAIYSPRPTPTAVTPSHQPYSTPTSTTSTPRALHLNPNSSDPLARLNPALLHSMRESFTVLDRSNTGTVTHADVSDILTQLGLDASPSSTTPYFHPGSTTMNLSSYLTELSSPLSSLSRPEELREAFAAFDVDDSGQIDVGDLREALLSGPLDGERRMSEREVERVMKGFVGRRTFARGATGGRGDVFRYAEFMAEVQGAGRSEVGAQGEEVLA